MACLYNIILTLSKTNKDTSLYKMACVQTAYGHRDDIYKLCRKFSVESPRDEPMLFAMVWNKFSSFIFKQVLGHVAW